MITKRDLEIFKFINKYGKTYLPVLEKTFFTSPSSAKNRIVNLKNSGLISYWNTKLASPKKAIVLSKETKDYLENELDIKVKLPTMNMSTIHHNIIEQIVDFYLSSIGRIERTTVANDHSKMHHIPDFIFYPHGSKMKVNIEVETSKKNQ
jgi:hypothetical protein